MKFPKTSLGGRSQAHQNRGNRGLLAKLQDPTGFYDPQKPKPLSKRIKKWLFDQPDYGSDEGVMKGEDPEIIITGTARIVKKESVSTPIYLPERHQKRKRSYGGNRDEDVTEVPAPRSMRRRDTGVVYIDVDAGAEEQHYHTRPSPPKKVKTQHERTLPTTLTPPQPGQQQLQPQAEKQQFPQQPENVQQEQHQILEDLAGPVQEQKPQQQQQALPIRAKQPATNASQLAGSSRPPDYFFKIVSEHIRNEIYRHLMVSHKPISVMGLWTKSSRAMMRHTRRGRNQQAEDEADTFIDARILRVCRQAHAEGIHILYSENEFLYKLRDTGILERAASREAIHMVWSNSLKAGEQRGSGSINFIKYGHLFRHMSLELEVNYTSEKYEQLMVCALEALVNRSCDPLSRHRNSPNYFPNGEILLHTLSITISPVWEEQVTKDRRRGGSGSFDDLVYNGTYLSVVKVFSNGHGVMRALRNINTNFLRINLHAQKIVDKNQEEEEEEGEEEEEMTLDVDVPRPEIPTDHLETTIDLRYHPRHLASQRDVGVFGDVFKNDTLIRERRLELGEAAEEKLSSLRRRIEGACAAPDEAVRRGWWENHAVAELCREVDRTRQQLMFEDDRTRQQVVSKGNQGVGEETDSVDDSEDGTEDGSERKYTGKHGQSWIIRFRKDRSTKTLRADHS